MFKINHIKLDTINSTNDYALSLKDSIVFKEGLLVTANYQTQGSGQRGRVWESNADENLLMSVVVEPKIELKHQSSICKIVALSVVDLLNSFGLKTEIKWPNDILVERKKIAGILIQNILLRENVTHSVIGLGLNINQLFFKTYSPNATSLRLQLNKEFDVSEIHQNFLGFLFLRLRQLKLGLNQDSEYLEALFLKEKPAAFESCNKRFMGIIKGVGESGELLVQVEDDRIIGFENQQLKYLF